MNVNVNKLFFKKFLYVKKERSNDLIINDLHFSPRIPIIEKGNEKFKSSIEQIINNSFFICHIHIISKYL